MPKTKVPLAYFCSAVLLGLAWLMPLHLLPWVSWNNEWPVFLWVVVAGWAILRSKKNAVASALVLPCMMILVVFGQLLAQRIPFAGDALVLGAYMWAAGIAILVGWRVQDWRMAFKLLAGVTVFVGVCNVLIQITQALNVWTDLEWINRQPLFRRPGANIGQPNQLATLLLWGVVGVMYLHFTGDKLNRQWKFSASFVCVLLGLFALGLALTESRTGLLSILLLALGWAFIPRRESVWRARAAAVAVVVFYVTMLWLVPHAMHMYWLEEGVSLGTSTSAGTRLVVWPQLWQAVLMKPWFGWGLRNVSEAHNAVLDQYPMAEPFTYAHNIVLDLAVGMGLPLTIFFCSFVLWWGWSRFRGGRQIQHWYVVGLLLPLTVHSMLEFPFTYAYFLIPACFALGVLERDLASKSAYEIPWRLLVTGHVAASVLLAWMAWEYILIEEDFRVARFEALHIGKTSEDYDRPRVHLLTQLDAMLVATRTTPRPGMKPEDIELLRKAAMRFPWTAIQGRYALALALNGNVTEAQRQLKVIRALYGDKMLQAFREQWREKAQSQYPQLAGVAEF
ncbi:MAG: hypothetical protein A3J24_02270 [Deltaproteobacteria bacterium RIFCSPLOWO2_02_FULL_53_8]|nr:MAG: hypothetical protein A3J24_02270 [Deltaproteobacteria bacterium RIFCSPLOWO2_02_FULL_53_8]